MRIPEPNDLDPTPPQTEDSAERGFTREQRDTPEPATYDDLGNSEELDHDDIGDIADEGPGHRG